MHECSDHEQCCQCSCHTKEVCHEKEEDKCDFFLELADEAWAEVLKEKIKQHILSTQNERMTELAKIVAEGNSQRWRAKMEEKQSCNNFKEQLHNFFRQGKK